MIYAKDAEEIRGNFTTWQASVLGKPEVLDYKTAAKHKSTPQAAPKVKVPKS